MLGGIDPFSTNIINNDIRVNNSSDDQHSVHSRQSTGSMGGRGISHVQALCNLYTPGNELFSSKTGVAAMMWTASVITVGIMPLIAFIAAALMDCCNSSKESNTITGMEEFGADNNQHTGVAFPAFIPSPMNLLPPQPHIITAPQSVVPGLVKIKLDKVLGIDPYSKDLKKREGSIQLLLNLSMDKYQACKEVAQMYNNWATSNDFDAGLPDMHRLRDWLQQKGLEGFPIHTEDELALRLLDILRYIDISTKKERGQDIKTLTGDGLQRYTA